MTADVLDDRSRHRRIWTILAAVLLPMSAIPSFVYRLALAAERIPLNYNEGWNALHVVRMQQGLPLYPAYDGLILNNYPPLSFELVRLLSSGGGDPLFVLRLLSLLGMFLTIAFSGATVAALGRSRLAGAVTAGLLFALFSIPFREYVAMADPALVAHGLMAVGMYLATRWWNSDRVMRLAVLVFTLAILTKHNLVALPVATALTLLAYERRRGIDVIVLGALAAVASVLLLRFGYGPDAIRNILAPRVISWSDASSKLRRFLPPIGVPILLALLGGGVWLKRPVERMLLLYLVLALAIAAFFVAGAGTNVNVLFDAAIASAVLCGLLVSRMLALPRPGWLVYAPLLLGLPLVRPAKWAMEEVWELQEAGTVGHRASDTREDVRVLGTASGPVACEMLSLCHWAGKGFEIDFFNAQQARATGRAGPDNLISRLMDGRYEFVQLIRAHPTTFPLSAADSTTFFARYEIIRRSTNGYLLARRSATSR